MGRRKQEIIEAVAPKPARGLRATPAQLARAGRELALRRRACAEMGIEPPSPYQILVEILNSPDGALDSPAWTPATRREGAVFQRYPQYQPPTNLQE